MGLRFQFFGKTAAEWTAANPVLLAREFGLETDTDLFKIGDGVTAWNSLGYGGMQGLQGDQGSQGSQGNQGDQGPQGNQGYQGTQGEPSTVQGPQGNQGDQGDQGYQGVQGAPSTVQGPQGDQGDDGAQGPQGYQGAPSTVQGPQGDQGADGDQGPQGFQGAPSTVQGPQGDQGEDGVDGPQGPQGFQGTPGAKGDQGDDGAQGPQGYQGAPSTVQGPQGDQGAPGTQGNQGDQGYQGNQGNQGYQGAAGSGNQTLFSVQGSQVTCAAQTVTNIFTAITVATGSQYEYLAVIGLQPAAGTQGAQVGIQCSVAGATVEGRVDGPQTTTATKSYRQTAQGVGTLPIQNVAGAQTVVLHGLITAPGSGTPGIGVQVKGVQASQAWYAKANCFLKLTKTS